MCLLIASLCLSILGGAGLAVVGSLASLAVKAVSSRGLSTQVLRGRVGWQVLGRVPGEDLACLQLGALSFGGPVWGSKPFSHARQPCCIPETRGTLCPLAGLVCRRSWATWEAAWPPHCCSEVGQATSHREGGAALNPGGQ